LAKDKARAVDKEDERTSKQVVRKRRTRRTQ